MRKFFLFLMVVYWNSAFSQLNDSFADGNFSASPVWQGDASAFTINPAKQLQTTQNASAQTFSLAAVSSIGVNVKWEFYIQLNFDPSANNQARIYLTSDNDNLKNSLNGYFIQIGETGSTDSYDLYRQNGTSTTRIIDGPAKSRANPNQLISRVQVIRTAGSVWELKTDITGGTNFISEGTVTDNTFISTSWFGIYCKYTTTNSDKFIFDDFKIETFITDNIPPKLLSASVIDSLTIDALFDEPLDSITAKANTNYNLNNGYTNPIAVYTTTDAARFRLKFQNGFNTGSYMLTVNNVKDKSTNVISGNNTTAFSYVKPYLARRNDLVINEIFADPSPQIDLPSVEFVELFNSTDHTIYLQGWKYSDASTTVSFPADSIKKQQFLILCAKADTNEFKRFGKVLGISPWPSLNNGGDILKLTSPENKLIDSVSYNDTWYREPVKKQGGWTLEMVDFKSLCQGFFNWNASSDLSGGTPGKQNAVYRTNYDQLPLNADSIKQLSDSTIRIFFNKHVDGTSVLASKFQLNPSNVNISAVSFDVEYMQATITYNHKFNANTLYKLNISGISDCSGNTITGTNQPFAFQTPVLPPIPPPPPVRLDTSKVFITEIFADPSPEIELPLVEFVEIYNPGKDTVDLEGWTLNDPGTKAAIKKVKIPPNEYLILCPLADTIQYKSFGKTAGISPWPSLNNSSDQVVLKSFKGRAVDSIAYSDAWYKDLIKKQGGWSLERIDPKSVCQGLYNWSASIHNSGGTPGKQNSVYRANYDQLVLKVDSLKQLSDSTLKIFFNKPVDASTVSAVKLILNSASATLNSMIFNAEYKQAILTFTAKFIPNTAYFLSISGLADCSGNIMTTSSQPVVFQTPPLPPVSLPPPVRTDTSKIYITEIFADPSPEVGLPLVEFVEIYNPGKDTIDLDNWTLNDPGTKAAIKKAKILPKEYLILCPVADTIQYKAFGKAVGISPWPSLNNTSDQIALKSFTGRTVDTISYSDNWYKNNVKKQGGWSLERIDPRSVCQGLFNWSASTDNSGGTPGKQNSVYRANYDQIGLKADSIKQLSDSTLKIFFNKAVDVSTVNSTKFILNPASANINSIIPDMDYMQVTLTYNPKFSSNTFYRLNISGISDCSGNNISGNQLSFQTPAPPPIPPPPPIRPDTSKICITEIFADPSPEVGLPLVEFVEIYNPGKDTIDLDNWTLNDPGTKATIKKVKILPNEYLILCPVADTIQYKAFGKAVGISPWPSLNNASDQIALKSFTGRTVDTISYSDNWYKNNVKKQGGWSLERIDPRSVCQGLFNWSASIDNAGGTPGKQNSVYRSDYDQIGLKADSIKQLSDYSIKIFFNKYVDGTSMLAEKFQLDPMNGNVAAISLDINYMQTTLTYNTKFISNTVYWLNISGVADCSGNTISGSQLSFKTPSLPPVPLPSVRPDTSKIYVTEIFADPSPEVGLPLSEFIEIYNPGKDTIDLDGWTLNDTDIRGTIKKVKLSPNEFLILCPIADTIQYKAFGKTTGLTPWPSLNNSSDQLSLKSFRGRTVDSISYSDTWYKDPLKKAGGWSLEKTKYEAISNGFYIWTASENLSGGTPGKANSTPCPDAYSIVIDTIIITSRSTLKLMINTIPDTAFIKASYFDLGIAGKASKAILGSTYKQIELKFETAFEEDKLYVLRVDSIRTFAGAIIDTKSNQQSFIIPGTPEINYKVIINEIFANISPVIGLPEVEFIELYNPSDLIADLKGLIYEDASGIRYTFKTGKIPPKGYVIVCPEKDTLNYKPFGNIIGISPWPSLNNDKDVLILRNNKGKEIDRISYTDAWYKNKEKQHGGWTLELIDPEAICSGSQNWVSSIDPAGGTPGKRNAVYKMFTTSDPLKLMSVILIDSITLELNFNRPVDSLSASFCRNFELNNGAGIPVSVLPVGPDFGQILLKFASGLSRATIYSLNVSNITDCSGTNILSSANTAEFIYPNKIAVNDIIINEILFNPRPSCVDFVEIYNKSDKILDIKELFLASTDEKDNVVSLKQLSKIQLLMQPHQYLVLTTDPDNIKKEYDCENPAVFLKVASLPDFNDHTGVVVLITNNIRVDQLNYSERMHFSLIKNPEGISLERSSFYRPTNEAGNFRSATASVRYATPGFRNSQYSEGLIAGEGEVLLASKTFSPDNDGFEDVLTLNYNFRETGLVANASVYNSHGALIKKLIRNQALAAIGTINWDGLTDYNERSAVGIYMIYLEVFNLNGTVKRYRKNCVLAAKLN